MELLARLVVGWAGNLLALWVASRLVDSIDYSSFGALALAAVVFGVVNLVVKPLAKLVGCVLIVLTLGVGLFLINMAMLALTAWIVGGFDVGGFWSVATGTAIVWLVNLAVGMAVDRLGERGREPPRRYA